MDPSSIDFVLVCETSSVGACSESSEASSEKRKIFENNLKREGLVLEHASSPETNHKFTTIHLPLPVLKLYAEILKLRMPMRNLPEFETLKSCSKSKPRFGAFKCFELDPSRFGARKEDDRFYTTYTRDHEYLFEVSARFFSPAIRSRIAEYICRQQRYSADPEDEFAFGIERLQKDGVYCGAYPLHDGGLRDQGSLRHLLLTEWASLTKCHKFQPLDQIREYLGVKVGLYFAWLGYYTSMLVPAAGLGLLCFIYGLVSVQSNQHTEDICHSKLPEPMCPLCNKYCGYWRLEETCFYARLTYLFDNEATILFAVLMSFWTVVFLEFWKRAGAEIKHKWDLSGFDLNDENPRPDYLSRLKNVQKRTLNVVTNIPEPAVSFWKRKLPNTLFSLSMILLLISLALSAVIAVILYRISVRVVFLSSWAPKDPSAHGRGLLLVNSTAVVLNLAFIFLFNWLYSFLAVYLTEIELHRTQSEFDESLTLKMYLLQFINFYSSIFYIAFFKGKFVGSPYGYNKILGFRQEECGPSGCMTELVLQLSIIMIGKQALNAGIEMSTPVLTYLWKHRFKAGVKSSPTTLQSPWARDFELLEWDSRTLFSEYLEMVIQFGFMSLFVAAFPLSPFFALINNVLEMRLDATKALKYYRRPVCHRVTSIGIWYTILDSVGKLSVFSNAFIIAFTSSFIPKLVYRLDHGGSLQGFLNQSLHSFNTSDFPEEVRSLNLNGENVTVCKYESYSMVPLLENQRIDFYWKVLLGRLAFVVVFQSVVSFSVIVLEWLIPDIPYAVQTRIRQESYIVNHIIIKHENAGKRKGGSERKGDVRKGPGSFSGSTVTLEDTAEWIELVV